MTTHTRKKRRIYFWRYLLEVSIFESKSYRFRFFEDIEACLCLIRKASERSQHPSSFFLNERKENDCLGKSFDIFRKFNQKHGRPSIWFLHRFSWRYIQCMAMMFIWFRWCTCYRYQGFVSFIHSLVPHPSQHECNLFIMLSLNCIQIIKSLWGHCIRKYSSANSHIQIDVL